MSNRWQELFRQAAENALARISEILRNYSYIQDLAKKIRDIKIEVIRNLDYYIETTMKSVESLGGKAYLADTAEDAREIVGKIVGRGKEVVFG
ncbi:MAG: lactate utilization protein, partial [Infirmifilum sp.]